MLFIFLRLKQFTRWMKTYTKQTFFLDTFFRLIDALMRVMRLFEKRNASLFIANKVISFMFIINVAV